MLAGEGNRSLARERRIAHAFLKRPERRQVLGRTPGDEASPLAVAAEGGWQGPELRVVQPFGEAQGQAGELWAGGHQEQAGRAGSLCQCPCSRHPRVAGALSRQ